MAEDLPCIEKDKHVVCSKMSKNFYFFYTYSIVARDSTAKVVLDLYFRTVHVATFTSLKINSCAFCKIHSHSHLKLQTVKNVCETPN
jgi:hypothetical protein